MISILQETNKWSKIGKGAALGGAAEAGLAMAQKSDKSLAKSYDHLAKGPVAKDAKEHFSGKAEKAHESSEKLGSLRPSSLIKKGTEKVSDYFD